MDEYISEAEALTQALKHLQHVSQETVAATIALVWTKFFDLGSDEVAQRMAAFEAVARRILGVS
jgi:hypothetical protein